MLNGISCRIHADLICGSYSGRLGNAHLMVEDEDKVSRFVSRGLIAERFAVDVARDGKSGWELPQTYQYDLIILDLMLPGLTGSEVLHRIRKSKSQVPVLVLTAVTLLGTRSSTSRLALTSTSRSLSR